MHLPISSKGEPLGTAYVQFKEADPAVSAWRALDKKTFQGRLLHILPGRARPGEQRERPSGSGAAEGVNSGVLGKTKEGREVVKGKKDEKRKEASNRGVNWASLYMNVSLGQRSA